MIEPFITPTSDAHREKILRQRRWIDTIPAGFFIVSGIISLLHQAGWLNDVPGLSGYLVGASAIALLVYLICMLRVGRYDVSQHDELELSQRSLVQSQAYNLLSLGILLLILFGDNASSDTLSGWLCLLLGGGFLFEAWGPSRRFFVPKKRNDG